MRKEIKPNPDEIKPFACKNARPRTRKIYRREEDGVQIRSAFYVDDVPVQIKEEFKAACHRRGKSMKGTLIKFMKVYARSDGKWPRWPTNGEYLLEKHRPPFQ